MYWSDQGYLLSKNNFDENSIIIEAFTLNHGKYTGIVYGGSSRKQKRLFQIGNKILLNWKSKDENKIGYCFTVQAFIDNLKHYGKNPYTCQLFSKKTLQNFKHRDKYIEKYEHNFFSKSSKSLIPI